LEEEDEVRRPGPSAKKRAMLNDSDNEDDIESKASSKENKNLFNAAMSGVQLEVAQAKSTKSEFTQLPPGKDRRKVKKTK
jgi:hypothetical protein